MSGGSEKLDIQHAPIMTPTQRALLESWLRSLPAMMQGFQLGTPYPGAKESGYNVTQFNPDFTELFSRKDREEREKEKKKTITKDELEKKENKVVKKGSGQGVSGAMANILNSAQPFRPNTIPMGQIPTPSNPVDFASRYMPELLTSPLISPLRYDISGNYPKRRL